MQRGELYLVRKPGSPVTRRADPKKQRVFVVVSRQLLVDSKFSTAICAPVYSRHDGLSTQVGVGTDEGLRHESSIHCDELVSLPKTMLSSYVGRLSAAKLEELNQALAAALGLDGFF
jgi:mRNA interferase MazF